MSRPLKRSLGLGLLVLYGVGTTVGAGIYALTGEIVSISGQLAPWSFLVASVMAGLTALSFAELSSRLPRAAGTALYVERGLRSNALAQVVGVLVVLAGVVSSAALMNGAVGYVQSLVEVPAAVVIVVAAVCLTLLAVWGMKESAWVAGVITLIEVGGLVWIIALSLSSTDLPSVDWAGFVPREGTVWPIFPGAVLSFYAFIGFEDMVEVAEEVKDVRRILPRAIIITWIITSLLYVALLTSVLAAVGVDFLATSTAPLADVHRTLMGGGDGGTILGYVALLAIVNGALIQIIMASRVVYGLASRGRLPQVLAFVSARFETPVVATCIVGLTVLTFALLGQLSGLAQITSMLMLLVFGLANLALVCLKIRREGPEGEMRVPLVVPALGALVCAFFVVRSVWDWLV